MYESLALLATFTFLYSLVAGVVEKSWISGAIVFTLFGVLVGPAGLDLLPLTADSETIRDLAELTLALVLFTDAAGADLGVLRHYSRLPARLLLIGLPLTILLGYLVGRFLFPDLPVLEVALLATLLAPTDAALGKPVITNPDVPVAYREGLNVESGLNDGICVPVLLLFLALAGEGASAGTSAGEMALALFAEEIGIGVVVGVGLVAVASFLGGFAARRGWIDSVWSMVTIGALAFSCFALAQALGGSGFIASFVGGLTLNRIFEGKEKETWLSGAESYGNVFSLVTWSTFGALVVGSAFEQLTPMVLLYALLSLTVIRMLPVYLSLAGTGMSTEAKLFVGWFGPRGLASVVFAVIVLDASLPDGNLLADVGAVTIILSILLHGLTANHWARAFGQREHRRLAAAQNAQL